MLRNAASLSYCILCILGIGLSEVGAPPEGRGLSENMCGIFGLYSHGVSRSQREVFGLLINGLKRLEYRGYDSAGVSVDVNASGCAASRPIVVKTVGTVDGLSSVLDKLQHGGQIQGKAFGNSRCPPYIWKQLRAMLHTKNREIPSHAPAPSPRLCGNS